MFFIVNSYRSAGQKTLRPVLHRVQWSLKAAFEGLRPSVGPDCNAESIPLRHRRLGKKLCRQFALTEFKGDWEYHQMIFQLVTKWNGRFICHLCRASRRPLDGAKCFSLFGAHHQRRSCVESIVECMPPAPVPLILVPGYHPALIKFCGMHTLALGIVQTANAESLLWMYDHGVHADTQDLDTHLRHSYLDFRQWLSRHGLSCSGRMFNSKRIHWPGAEFPFLAYKAFNGRIVAAWAASVLCSAQVQAKITERKPLETDEAYSQRMHLNSIITSCMQLDAALTALEC